MIKWNNFIKVLLVIFVFIEKRSIMSITIEEEVLQFDDKLANIKDSSNDIKSYHEALYKLTIEEYEKIKLLLPKANIDFNPILVENASDVQASNESSEVKDIDNKFVIINKLASKNGLAFVRFCLYHEIGNHLVKKLFSNESHPNIFKPGLVSSYAADTFALWFTNYYSKNTFKLICDNYMNFSLITNEDQGHTIKERISHIFQLCNELPMWNETSIYERMRVLIKYIEDKYYLE